MPAQEIQQRLREGIAAIKRGDLEHGRSLLLQVVEADNRIEPAWLWLSAVVDDPADKLVALENALVLNPTNPHAQAQAERLRQQLGITERTPPRPAPVALPSQAAPEPAPAVPLHTAVDPDDDPDQCAYCGRPAVESDNRCPHCGRNLLVQGPWEGKGFRNILLVLSGAALQGAFLQFFGPLFALVIARAADPSLLITLSRLPAVTSFFGDYPRWSESVANSHLIAAILRILVWFSLFLMFYTDVEAAHPAAAVVAPVDLAWALVGYRLGYLGNIAAILNGSFGGIILLFSGITTLSQRQARVRQRVTLDRDAYGALEMYRRGQKYGRAGKWALAAIHWQKAVVLNSGQAQWYKNLGIAQAKLGRYPKALDTLREGANRAPADAEFKTLIAAVQAQTEQK